MASSNNDHIDSSFQTPDGIRKADAERTLWGMAGIIYARRKFIVVVSFAVAVIVAVIMLLIPNSYTSTATVLIPEGGSNPLSAAVFRNLPSAASSLLGGSSGDYVRYMAILKSRSVLEAAVDSFKLVQVYDVDGEDHPREDAVEVLSENVEISLDKEFDYLKVSASDSDPKRAAALANFLVRRLNELNARLSSQNASNYRQFIEKRYFQARADMDSVLDATAAFQREHGVYDLPTQAEGFFTQVASLRARAMEAEIQHEALLAQYGPENPQVESFREIAEAANRKYSNALGGHERLLPVPQSEVPAVGRQYVDLQLEQTIQRTILEVLGPMYEQARLQEEQTSQAVQILDEAVPPIQKSGPKRTVTVLAAALSAFILAIIYVLVLSWWRENHAHFAHRLETANARKRIETPST